MVIIRIAIGRHRRALACWLLLNYIIAICLRAEAISVCQARVVIESLVVFIAIHLVVVVVGDALVVVMMMMMMMMQELVVTVVLVVVHVVQVASIHLLVAIISMVVRLLVKVKVIFVGGGGVQISQIGAEIRVGSPSLEPCHGLE